MRNSALYRRIRPPNAGWPCSIIFPPTRRVGIEFPLTGHDLTAVTRRYVNLLRED